MADFNSSSNMSLPIPTVGIAGGPLWATLLDSCLTILDGHSHVAGSGIPITPSAMNINIDLPMGGNNLTSIRTLRLASQPVVLDFLVTPSDVGCLYEVGTDLYYNSGLGAPVQITAGGSLAGAAGTITGLPSGTASAVYSAGTFVWQSASTPTAANMDFGSAIMRDTSPNSTFAVTLSPITPLPANYTLTLPTVPVSTSFMQLDTSGIMSAAVPVSLGITASNIAASTITGTQIATNVDLNGTSSKVSGSNIVSSNTNAAKGLQIVRGYVDISGNIISGEGFTVSTDANFDKTITFTTPFGDIPAVNAIGITDPLVSCPGINLQTTSQVRIRFILLGGGLHNCAFMFTAIGQRV